jgi:hypothetical protein
MQFPLIKFCPLSYGNGFFLNKRYYCAFIIQQVQKNTFSQRIFNQNVKLLNGPRFNVYQYHSPQKNSTHNLSFGICMFFSYFVIGILLLKINSMCSSFSMCFFKELTNLSLKLRCGVLTLPQKTICRKLICDKIFGSLEVCL